MEMEGLQQRIAELCDINADLEVNGAFLLCFLGSSAASLLAPLILPSCLFLFMIFLPQKLTFNDCFIPCSDVA